jgi:catecholate siderophore receptor
MGRDHVDASNYGVAPSLVLGLGTPTRITLGSQHIRQDKLPDGGIPSIGIAGFYNSFDPAVNGGARVDTSNYYGLLSDYEKVNADMATIKIEHDLASGAKLTNISRYGKSKMDRVLTGINAIDANDSTDPANWTIVRSRQSVLQDNEIFANQTNLVSDFKTGAVTHTVSAGLEFMSEKQVSIGRGGLGTVANANLYNPNPNDAIAGLNPASNGAYTRGGTNTAAVYAFDTVKLSEQFQINGGLRAERYTTDTNSATVSAGNVVTSAPYLEKSDTLVSWKAGALYKPAPNGSIYAAFATSKTPPGSANFSLSASAGNISGPNMDPQETRNVELGTKWDVLAKTLALTAALYRTENMNEISLLDMATNTYSQLGKRRVQGLELGMVGQFTRNWQVTAGLATMKATVIEGSTGNNAAGAATRWSPDLTATVWSSYNVNDKLTIGGGVRYMSEQKRLVDPSANPDIQNVEEIPAYAVADAVLAYKVSKSVTLQLNVYNLTDKFYINALNNGGSRFALGLERSAQLSANIAF